MHAAAHIDQRSRVTVYILKNSGGGDIAISEGLKYGAHRGFDDARLRGKGEGGVSDGQNKM